MTSDLPASLQLPLAQQSIGDYLAGLASGEPIPGGGAAAALTLAQAAALLAMVVRVSTRATIMEGSARLVAALDQCRAQALAAADADAAAFAAVIAAYALPKVGAAEAARRATAVEGALAAAAAVPLGVIEQVRHLLGLVPAARALARASILSDVIVSLHLAAAAEASAVANVEANTRLMKDAAQRERFDTSLVALRQGLQSEVQRLLATCLV